MRFATTFATTAALAASTLAAPAAEPAPVCNPQSQNQGRPATAATMTFPATCTAIVTSVATSTVVVTKTYTHIPSSTRVPSLPDQPKCVTDEDAEVIADIFRLLIQSYSDELALAALTEDFVDWASSVNILMNGGAQFPKNITGPTFSGRQAFMDGQGSQPEIPFTKLHVFHGCDSVSMNWLTERSAAGQKTEVASIPVVGNVILTVVPAEAGSEYNFRINNIYSEFNTAAWIVNLGLFTPAGPVNYLNATNTTSTAKRAISFDPSLRGPMI
ncbi:hypothetical protein LTR36_010558 [Oleoguttula mirabilis]|uniref:NTF2-like domain-containing protein n=1 Tax=Oleoguttula mirabilis TaxID=1507867 RepID=A0AAV9JQV1_9PEZI|nr:hypothetical protein LTR36_010558 [Oleoguttula mirabilis]